MENDTHQAVSEHRAITPNTILSEKLFLLRQKMASSERYSEIIQLVNECIDLVAPLDDYIESNTTRPSQTLRRLEQNTNALNWESAFDSAQTALPLEKEMLSGAVEGQFLKMLVEIAGAKRILEIGSFTGYASLAMAEGLPEDGKLYACEYDAFTANFAREQLLPSDHAHKIEILTGDAMDSMSSFQENGETFDLVFLDADKKGYSAYYRMLMDGGLMNKGGIICIDNTLYMGESYAPGEISENGKAIRAFNAMVAADDRVRQVMLPLRDGVTIVRCVR